MELKENSFTDSLSKFIQLMRKSNRGGGKSSNSSMIKIEHYSYIEVIVLK